MESVARCLYTGWWLLLLYQTPKARGRLTISTAPPKTTVLRIYGGVLIRRISTIPCHSKDSRLVLLAKFTQKRQERRCLNTVLVSLRFLYYKYPWMMEALLGNFSVHRMLLNFMGTKKIIFIDAFEASSPTLTVISGDIKIQRDLINITLERNSYGFCLYQI